MGKRKKKKYNIYKSIIFAVAALFLLFMLLVWSSSYTKAVRTDVSVSVNNVIIEPSECGEGKGLKINITVKNNENVKNEWLYSPYVITNKGKGYHLTEMPEIPSHGTVNVILHTYESEKCESLSNDEFPETFVYHVDLPEPLPPARFKINIPKKLITGNLIKRKNSNVQTLLVSIIE